MASGQDKQPLTPVLYHSEMSVCAAKVRMLFADKKVTWESRLLDLRAGDAQAPDYVRLNPNQLVPTLVCGSDVVIESNIILEYVEDRWPEPGARPSARPPAPYDAARMRLWMRRLDDVIHPATATVSVCIALRHQFLKRRPEEVQQWLDNMVDPARRARSKASIELGMDAEQFNEAVQHLRKLLDEFEQALAGSAWLAGDSYSLADIAYSPYMLRFDQLGFGELVAQRPHVADWQKRLFARPGFQAGVVDWLNPAAVALFEREAPEARRRVAEILNRNSSPRHGAGTTQ